MITNICHSRRKPERVEWLYTGGGSSGPSATATTAEDYLLGKRRFEPSLQKSSEEVADGGFGEVGGRGPLSTSSSVNSHTEYEARLREDPLLVIKQKEMEFRSRKLHLAGSRSDMEKVPCKSSTIFRRSRSPPRERHRVPDGRASHSSRASEDPRSRVRSPERRGGRH